MRLARLVPVAGAALLLGACTSTLPGFEGLSTLVPPAGTSRSASTSASAASGSSVSSGSPTAAPPSGPYARTPVTTAIGDPATADLCAAVDLGAFSGLGLTAVFAESQFPPGCSVELADSGRAQVSISAHATPDPPSAPAGATTRVASGLTVTEYPFDAKFGDCERDLAAAGLTVRVNAFPASTDVVPVRARDCGGTDAMVDTLAAAVSQNSVPRLGLASPTVTDLDVCAVAGAAGLTSLPALTGAASTAQGFGLGCELRPADAFVFLNVVIDRSAAPRQAQPGVVEGHRMYASTSNSPTFCSFVSVQGRTADGRHEELSASADAASAKHAPAHLCAQTGRALAMVLDAAGLH